LFVLFVLFAIIVPFGTNNDDEEKQDNADNNNNNNNTTFDIAFVGRPKKLRVNIVCGACVCGVVPSGE